MIGVYLQPERTQFVRGKLRKDTLVIEDSYHLEQSYLSVFDKSAGDLNRQERAKSALRDFFRYTKERMGNRDGIYIVLPDYLFRLVDCFQYESDEMLEQQIKNATNLEIDDLYYSTPIRTTPAPQNEYVTVYAIERWIADAFIKAADEENAKLFSIEAASMAFLRSTGSFSKEEFMLQSFMTHGTMIAYSSLAGLFKIDFPELSIENLKNRTESAADTLIQTTIIQLEAAAEQTFSFMNQDIPFIVQPAHLAHQFPTLSKRVKKTILFPDYIDQTWMDERQQNWMCPVGTMLQDVDYSAERYQENMDSYMKLFSGNILPEDVQQNTKAYQILQKIQRGSYFGILGLTAVLFLEIGGMLFFSGDTTVPQSLKNDYETAQKSMADIKKELSLIDVAGKEHEYPLDAMTGLLEAKPDGMGFISVKIGSNNTPNSPWITLKAAAVDPIVFQTFIGNLTSKECFSNVSITQIESNGSNGAKTADITIGKGKVGE